MLASNCANLNKILAPKLTFEFLHLPAGRRPICALGALGIVLSGLGAGVAPSWHFLALAMAGMGLAYGAFVDASMTLASETVGPRHRIVQAPFTTKKFKHT